MIVSSRLSSLTVSLSHTAASQSWLSPHAIILHSHSCHACSHTDLYQYSVLPCLLLIDVCTLCFLGFRLG